MGKARPIVGAVVGLRITRRKILRFRNSLAYEMADKGSAFGG